MEILIVVLLLLIIAGLAFAWMKFRPGAPGGADGIPGDADGLRGRRGAAVASRHDPMAEAVERHSMATDPHEAAEAELQLQAQANRVAADLHARQASALESEVGGNDRLGHTAPANGYDQPDPVTNGYGQPVAANNGYGQPVSPYDGPPPADTRPVYEDDDGRPVYEDGTPVYREEPPPRY
ncbi:MAG TPA: hypothetical protein VNA28_06110 [Solirubrobacteraceae bacterium]|nr:hypothetical protein [Solirubrobacteraceae bacterium]